MNFAEKKIKFVYVDDDDDDVDSESEKFWHYPFSLFFSHLSQKKIDHTIDWFIFLIDPSIDWLIDNPFLFLYIFGVFLVITILTIINKVFFLFILINKQNSNNDVYITYQYISISLLNRFWFMCLCLFVCLFGVCFGCFVKFEIRKLTTTTKKNVFYAENKGKKIFFFVFSPLKT